MNPDERQHLRARIDKEARRRLVRDKKRRLCIECGQLIAECRCQNDGMTMLTRWLR